jgi:AcrR family transcriptional regulator
VTAKQGAAAADLTRPRSVRAHDAALRAARDLLNEGGLPAATVDAISARSGVSKATLYNHWPSRTALAAEAWGQQMADQVPVPDTGSLRGDLMVHMRRVSDFYGGPDGAVFAQLIAAGVTDPDGASYFRDYFLAGRRETMAAIWQRAQGRGEVRDGIDLDTFIDVLAGPLIFRVLTGHAPLDHARADAITDTVLTGLLRPPDRSGLSVGD